MTSLEDYSEHIMGAQDYSSGGGYEAGGENQLTKMAFNGEGWRQHGGYQEASYPSGFHAYQPSPFDFYPQYSGPTSTLPSYPSCSYPPAQYGAVLSQTLEVVRGPYGQYSETRRMTTHLPTSQPASQLPAIQQSTQPLTNEPSQQLAAGNQIPNLVADQLMQPYPQIPTSPPTLPALSLPALLPPGAPHQAPPLPYGPHPQAAPLPLRLHDPPGPPGLSTPPAVPPPKSPLQTQPSEVLPGFSLSVVEHVEGPEVVLQGDGCRFIQAVHKAALDFLKMHKVPFPIFAKIILRKRKVEVQRFLQRTNWDKLEIGEQLLYAKLYKWLGQPEQARLEKLRVDGTNTTTERKAKRGIQRKENLTENVKEEVEQEKEEEERLKPDTSNQTAVTEEKPKLPRGKKKLQPRLSPKDGHTSAEQRKQIREWSQRTVGKDKDGNHTKEQKEAFAAQLHLPLAVINRVIR